MADACKQQLNYSRQAKFMIDETRREMNRNIDEVNSKLDRLMQAMAQHPTGAGPSPPGTGRTTTPVQQTPFLNEPTLPPRTNRSLPGLPLLSDMDSPIRQVQLDERFGNIIIQFSRNSEHAQNNARAIPGLRYPEFSGSDMSSFPEWASQFFNAVNLFKPIEEQACQTALVLMKERASEMVQPLTATAPKDFKLLMIRLDEIFNPSGNQQVALALFETFVQKEDMTIQEYAHEIESLYRRAYPSLSANQSGHLMFRFINGLLK